jgi:hypothetical protein
MCGRIMIIIRRRITIIVKKKRRIAIHHPLPWNGQNAKKLKNTKMIIAGYSPNRN